MVVYPILNRIRKDEASAEEARAGLRQLLDEHGLKIYTHVFSALRVWTLKVLTSGRTDATELDQWFQVLKGVSVTMARRDRDSHDSVAVDVLAEIIYDYLSKLMRDAFDASDPFHREYLVHRRLGRFMRGDPIDFVNQRPPGEMSWSGRGDQCVEFIHVRRPGTRDAGWPGITRDWFERKVALEGDHEIGAGFDMLHMLQEDAVTQVSLIQTLRDLHDAFAPWTAQTVKQEQAIAAAKQVLAQTEEDVSDQDISSESRDVITDIFGTAVLVSDQPVLFTVHEVDIMLKVQRALTTRRLDPAGMKPALERIERWFDEFPDTGKTYDNGTPIPYSFCYGSNGERDYMRGVARAALARVPPSFEDVLVESIREFADQVLSAGQDCCIDPDAGPDATTTVRFTGKEGCEIGTALHRIVGMIPHRPADELGS